MPAAPRAASVSPSKPAAAPSAAVSRRGARSRLRKTDEISSVFDFRCRENHGHLAGLAKPNSLGYPRLALMISKKVAPLAVDRNYMRRVLREHFRQLQAGIPALDIVVRVTKSFNNANFAEIGSELAMIMQRLGKCLKS
jgi:ribonuclease P protein component